MKREGLVGDGRIENGDGEGKGRPDRELYRCVARLYGIYVELGLTQAVHTKQDRICIT